ncbi:MAG: hypothetical protein ACR2QE_09460 [Acidimicrobiales bacterium]
MTATDTRAEPSFDQRLLLQLSMVVWAGILLAIMAMAPLDAGFSSDDGAYGIQVRSLVDDGRWALDRPVPVVPVDNEGVVNGWRTTDGPVAYPNHPVYIQLLRASSDVIGEDLGLRLLVFLGALLAPLVAWKLSDELEMGWGAGAFWLVALSPLAVHSTGLWAHAPTAALAGAATIVVARTRRRGPPGSDAIVVAATLAAGVLLRREMLLFAAALLVAWLVLRWCRRTVTAVGVSAIAVAAAVVAERTVRQWIATDRLDSSVAGNETAGWIADQVGAAWHTLIEPSHVGGLVGAVALLGAGLVIAGAVRIRRQDPNGGRMLLVAGAAVLALRVLLGDAELSSGIVVAWPIATAGVIVGWADDRAHRFLAGTVGLFVVAVLVTQHPDGGGLEWGGRYFSPALAAVAVLASGGLWRLWQADRTIRAAAVAVLLAPTLAGVLAAGQIRERNADVVAYVDQLNSSVVITDQPALPRVAWSTVPDTAWYRATSDDVDELLGLMSDAGVETITLQGFGDVLVDETHYSVEQPQRGLRLLTLRS